MSRKAEDESRRGQQDEAKDEVEGHFHGGKGRSMTDEPKADDESSDEVEGHFHGGKGRSMTDEPQAEDDSSDDFEAHSRRA